MSIIDTAFNTEKVILYTKTVIFYPSLADSFITQKRDSVNSFLKFLLKSA